MPLARAWMRQLSGASGAVLVMPVAIVVSLALFFFNWRWALVLFVGGWILQFVGHAIEGNQPAFFKNPVYLLVGPLWLLRRAAASVGLLKSAK